MNIKQINDALKNNTYLVIASIPITTNEKKLSIVQFIKHLREMLKRFNMIKVAGQQYQTTLDLNSQMTSEIIFPFNSNKNLNEFLSGNKTISVKDLEMIFSPSKMDIAQLELHENHPNLFTSQSDLYENIKEGLEEVRDISYDKYEDAIRVANEISNEFSKNNLSANELNNKLNNVQNAKLVREFISANAQSDFNIKLGENSLHFGGNYQIPKSLPDMEYTIKNCRITEFLSKSSCNIYISSDNNIFLAQNSNIKSNLLNVAFIKDNLENLLLKYLEASKIKFDMDIQVNRAILDNKKSYSILKIHNQDELINLIVDKLVKLGSKRALK